MKLLQKAQSYKQRAAATVGAPVSHCQVPCGLVSTSPEGIAGLVRNDICTDVPVANVTVVIRSQTAQAQQLAAQTTAASADTTGTLSVVCYRQVIS